MTEDTFSMHSVHIENLFAAARAIESEFLSGGSPPSGKDDNKKVEHLVRVPINTVYFNLYALATADLKTRAARGAWFLQDSVLYDFDEIAIEAAKIPFSSRTADGMLPGIAIILDYFSERGGAGKPASAEDFALHLIKVTTNNVSNIIRQIFKSEKNVLSFVHAAVGRHIRQSDRYGKKGRFVVDLKAGGPKAGLAGADARGLVDLCAPALSGSKTPAQVVDLIFDKIAEDGRYRSYLEFTVLRQAVFDLIKARFIPPAMISSREAPDQSYVQKRWLETAMRAIDETADSYNWREGGSAEFRDLYVKAARHRLEELIRSGRTPSASEAFREVQGDGGEDYSAHKGAFQNFWKRLWERFLDNF
ncbi:MAG TPA: hypothetical protein VLA34_08515 [Candidatus Krumholzibacterium sp.]|nr:hypothetical protein [Candidatus Krumholzibacterium sp.]